MKRNLYRGLFILIMGAFGMFNLFGCSGRNGFQYEKYSGVAKDLNFSLDYLVGWKISEKIMKDFTQLIFLEPKKEGKVFGSTMAITVKEDLPFATAAELAEDTVRKASKLEAFQVVNQSSIKIHGAEGKDLELSYKTLESIYQLNAKMIPVRERMIVFKKGSKFYVARYENTEEEFAKFNQAFTHIIKSIKFKDKK